VQYTSSHLSKYLNKMFGFLFKKNKNPESKGQSRKSSKDLLNVPNENENNGSPSPIVPLTFQRSLNSVSLSSDSLSQSTTDSGKDSSGVESFDRSSTASLNIHRTFPQDSTLNIRHNRSLADLTEDIQFIDEIPPEPTIEFQVSEVGTRESENAVEDNKWVNS